MDNRTSDQNIPSPGLSNKSRNDWAAPGVASAPEPRHLHGFLLLPVHLAGALLRVRARHALHLLGGRRTSSLHHLVLLPRHRHRLLPLAAGGAQPGQVQVQEAILHLLEQLQHHHQQLLPDRADHPHAGVRAARAGDRGGPGQVELSNFVIDLHQYSQYLDKALLPSSC